MILHFLYAVLFIKLVSFGFDCVWFVIQLTSQTQTPYMKVNIS